MGVYMHTTVQVRKEGIWETVDLDIFPGNHYGLYGWLADVRNYSAITPVLPEQRGVPDDFEVEEEWVWSGGYDFWGASWILASELASVDFDQTVEDRRCARGNDCGCTCEPGEGEKMTLAEFLGEPYVSGIKKVIARGDARMIFWFH